MAKIEADVRNVAVCYPTDSLSSQMALWARKHEDCEIEPVFGRLPMDIRRSLYGADFVLVDASQDHAQAIELFSQSVARLGARRVAVYTEKMHEGLEMFVRTQGAWLLLGPLASEQWEDLFSTLLPARTPEPALPRNVWRRAA